MKKSKLIFVVGPTASGKTGLAVELAKKLNGEIVSADSMQIYKGMSVASAAPTKEEMQGIPHHLIEFLSDDVNFTVSDYVKAAREKIENIIARGKTPIVAGGTGLYVDSLANNVEFVEGETDLALREELECRFDTLGAEEMLRRMNEFDPISAAKLHPNDRRRIIRVFELYEGLGVSKSKQDVLSIQNESPYENIIIGLNYKNREILYDRINRRVDTMVQNGLVDEAKRHFENRALGGAVQAIGHKELFLYFEGSITLEEAVENLKRATRRYAKRQITWFSRNEDINFIYPDETENVLEEALSIIERK